MSWMQKLRDARTTTKVSDAAPECLNAFLDHMQSRSVWTDKMVPLRLRGSALTAANNVRVIKSPDKSKLAQGAHVHYALMERLVMFRIDTFLNFVRARDSQNTNEHMVMRELRTRFKATDHKGRLLRGTPYMHAMPSNFLAIPVPPGSLLERRMFGENSPAVENAMQAFERGLERRRDIEARRAERAKNQQ